MDNFLEYIETWSSPKFQKYWKCVRPVSIQCGWKQSCSWKHQALQGFGIKSGCSLQPTIFSKQNGLWRRLKNFYTHQCPDVVVISLLLQLNMVAIHWNQRRGYVKRPAHMADGRHHPRVQTDWNLSRDYKWILSSMTPFQKKTEKPIMKVALQS